MKSIKDVIRHEQELICIYDRTQTLDKVAYSRTLIAYLNLAKDFDELFKCKGKVEFKNKLDAIINERCDNPMYKQYIMNMLAVSESIK